MYFPGGGRAKAIRLTFAAAGIDFEDRRLNTEGQPTYASIMNDQGKCPLGTVPILLQGDNVIASNSHSIRRYIARIGGLDHENAEDALRGEEIEAVGEEIFILWSKVAFASDAPTKATNLEEFKQSGFPYYAAYIEKLLASGVKKHKVFVGPKLTSSDIFLFVVLGNVTNLIGNDWTEQFPRLAALQAAVADVPAIKGSKFISE